MSGKRKYNIGYVTQNWKIINVIGKFCEIECIYCGKVFNKRLCNVIQRPPLCSCLKNRQNEKIQALKEKYKNGVTMDILQKWLGGGI